jgi:hypothetical protein
MKTIIFLDEIPPEKIRVVTDVPEKAPVHDVLDAIFFAAYGYRPASSFSIHPNCRCELGVTTGNGHHDDSIDASRYAV